MSSATKNFVLIAFIALILRLAMFLIVFEHPERAIVRDLQSYLIPAINIVDGHGFSSRVQPPFTASANRTPGYPLFIATLYALFGRNAVVIAFVQVLIDTVSTILTCYLGLRLVSNKAAFLGALGYALSLGPAIYAVLIMTETLFTFCLLGAIITFTIYRDWNRVRWLVGAASNPRFRLPIMPYICLLAGTGLAFIIDSYRRQGHSETGKLIVKQQ